MKRRPIVAVLAIAALLAAGCGRADTDVESVPEGGASAAQTAAASSDFGDLSDVCGPGDASTATAQGVTADSIEVGTFSDVGFTKNPEFVDTAKVFTSWCNSLGGINGREIVSTTRDSKLTEVRQRMIEACRDDFALVGGGSALDGLGVKDRLGCTLPSFPAQVAQATSVAADLELSASPSQLPNHDVYTGFRTWLTQEKYPESRDRVGFINGDSPVVKVLGDKAVESLQASGATVVYNELYPISGMSDWNPYAQAIKAAGVRGLVFYGDFRQLPKLEDSLASIDYELDWIDATNNAYSPAFLELMGSNVERQNNYLDLGGVTPLERADEVPAMGTMVELFDRYAPDATITLPSIRAMSAWLLFAKSASSCGDELTRKCVYDAAAAETDWTGGGLTAPIDLADPSQPSSCFNAEIATPDGFEPADFGPDEGLFRCDIPPYEFRGTYDKALTLADVGKSMNEFE